MPVIVAGSGVGKTLTITGISVHYGRLNRPQPTSSAVLGRPSPIVLALAVAGVGFFLFATVNTAAVAHRWSSVIGNTMGYALVSAVVWLVGTSRVVGESDALRLVNFAWVIDIPVSSVADVDGDNGLRVTTANGKVYRSFALGASAWGTLMGSRRSRHAAARCRSWLVALGAAPADEPSDAHIYRRLRMWSGMAVPAWPAFYCGFAAIIHYTVH